MAAFCSQIHESSLLQPKKIRFFKIILEDTVRDKKLEIPRSFVKKYGNALSNQAILKLPDGASWKIELFKGCYVCCDVWLSEGWQEFVDYYSVKLAHLLLFTYEGNSQFSVVIFSKTATEIDYPLRNMDFKFQEPKREETEDGFSAEAMDVDFPNPTKSGQEREQPLRRPKNEKTFQRATAFKSKNPLMVINMRPSYVPPAGNKMNLPETFSRKYLLNGEGSVMHFVFGGKIWPVKYAKEEGRTRVKLKSGWRTFAKDNHLEIDDVCVFELIPAKGAEISFKVHIFRVAEDRPSDSSLGKEQKTHEKTTPSSSIRITSESARKFVSKNPFFKVVMKASYLYLYLHIPTRFARMHSKHWEKNTITLQVEDRSWNAMLTYSGSRLTGGWIRFAKENFLKEDDVCIFELIDRSKLILKVSIFRSEN
ncbi:B3 domain-containing transcription factor VRN1 [Hevea brasiliensis]|uniref:B3 domain-containing transcription factor VRN1 n=1 Tax=Hevea brasiliensis TaxID=3981 RepID=UPI0025D0CE39|nr:B3 domain-containing transcription factor VRN1 [Hevea brasiliensis]